MPEQFLATGAVFLSYASQDADAAARICEALRAAGVEVWFDRSELRGGDAWDSQIKKQIHDCALFIPVISAHTNARIEGYFRGEWTLATRRLVNRAHDAAFLMPVVIDETREADARVPEEFLRAQWTWLPGGKTPPAFAGRVRQLLGGDSALMHHSQTAVTGAIEPNLRSRTTARPWHWFVGGRGRHRVGGVGLVLIALLLVLGGGAFWYYQGASDAPVVKPAPAAASTVAAAAPNEKSIAVLPFVDMSQAKDQEYFADGLTEELINLLAQIEKLRVIGRTSSFQFKGKNEDLRTIGEALNVAHVLEGSVRKSGDTLRITAQLVRASDSSHLWSETFDRKLENVFATQDEIAGAVVGALKLRLVTGNTAVRAPRRNLEAYNQYLLGRFQLDLATRDALDRALAHFQAAIRRDPEDALAWVGLSNTYVWQAGSTGQIPLDQGFRLGRHAAERAVALDPELAHAHAALGFIQSTYDWNWHAADASFDRAYELAGTDPEILLQSGRQDFVMGRFPRSMTRLKQALDRDPLRSVLYVSLAFAYAAMNRLDDAEAAARQGLKFSPNAALHHYQLASALLLQRKFAEAEREMTLEVEETWRACGLPLVHFAQGRRREADASLKSAIELYGNFMAFQIAEIYAFRGERELAFKWLDRAFRQRDGGLTFILSSPYLAKLRSDPRFAAMVRKLGLPNPT